MNPFTRLQNDTVFIVKPDGQRLGPYKTAVGPKGATIFEPELDVDVDDTLERQLPGTKTELFAIADVDYRAGLGARGGIPAHWVLTLRKAHMKDQIPDARTTIHINNSTGFQVGDHNNLVIENAIADLIKKVEEGPGTLEEKAEAKGRIGSLLKHPLVTTVIGGATQALIKLAGS